MRLKSIAGVVSVLIVGMTVGLIVGSAAMLAAPEQNTQQPGQPTEAHVWVQNRGRREAVPVDLQESNLDNPLRVRIMNGEPGQAAPILVRVAVPLWDYKLVTVPPTADMAALLTVQGSTGWETTGAAVTAAEGTTFLLKRPH
jgi:hypothetical protein